jgi:hypothetical protein
MIGIKSLRIGIEQMYRPRIRVPMLGIRQKIAIGRSRIDASQHRHGTLEDFVMQADTNCRQILGSIDGARLPGRGLKPVVDRADADGDVKQIAQQLFYPSVRTAADQDQGQRQLVQPRFGHRQIEKYAVILGGKRLIKRLRCLLLLPIEKLPANSLPVS